MAITKKDVEYAAYLSRIKIPPEHMGRFTKQLSDIISYMDKLKKVDTEGVAPTSHPLPLKNIFRKDEIGASLDTDAATRIAPQKKGSFFQVPRVIEEK